MNFTPKSKEEAISRVIDHLISRLWSILCIRDILKHPFIVGLQWMKPDCYHIVYIYSDIVFISTVLVL